MLQPAAFPILRHLAEDLRETKDVTLWRGVLDAHKRALYRKLAARCARTNAMALTLKALNICLARHHLQTRAVALLSRPVGLVVDPSNMCRLACPGCVHSESNVAAARFDWANGTLREKVFHLLLERYGAYSIGMNLYNYGEPLLNRSTPKLIRQAKRYLMHTALSTSLSVQHFDAEAYVASGLDCMILSIDGITQQVYQSFRRNGNLELVLENLRRLVDVRRRLRSRTPVLVWNFLGFEHNIHEIGAARRMARRLGVDLFQLVRPFDVSWDDPAIRPAEVQRRLWRFHWLPLPKYNPRLERDADAGPIEAAFERPWIGEADSGNADSGHTCHWLYKNTVVDAAGRVLPCCSSPAPGTNLVFGRADANSADLYNTRLYQAARSFFANGMESSGDAPHCTRCEWNQDKVNIGSEEIWRYFHSADATFFDARSLEMLAGW